jgi:hypothetical protein
MKQNQITLIIIGFILVALMATNPSTEEHKEAVKEKVSAAIENNNSNGNAFQKLGQTIGIALIDKMIKRENYLIFSITKVKLLDIYKNEKVVGYGILGKVYLTNDFSENTGFSSEEIFAKKDTVAFATESINDKNNFNRNDVKDKANKIGNLEVAELDFPKEMNWEDAKKACEALGKGWRLPTIDELNIMYQNKSKISDFENIWYWSSTEYNSSFAWLQEFSTGGQNYYEKSSTNYVRAVRSI